MSDSKTKALVMIKNLQERANAGDLQARKTLEKVLAGVRTRIAQQSREQAMLSQLVDSGALDHMLVRGDGDTEQLAGDQTEDGHAKDELDVSDDMLRLNPTMDDLAHRSA